MYDLTLMVFYATLTSNSNYNLIRKVLRISRDVHQNMFEKVTRVKCVNLFHLTLLEGLAARGVVHFKKTTSLIRIPSQFKFCEIYRISYQKADKKSNLLFFRLERCKRMHIV